MGATVFMTIYILWCEDFVIAHTNSESSHMRSRHWNNMVVVSIAKLKAANILSCVLSTTYAH